MRDDALDKYNVPVTLRDNTGTTSFEDRIERIMIATKSYSDTDLARALEITPQSVTAAKRKGKIPPFWYEFISNKFKISADWLLYGGEVKHITSLSFQDNDLKIQPACLLDKNLLCSVITGIEEGLEQMNIALSPEKKGELVILLYEYFAETDKKADPVVVNRYLRLLA